MPAPANPATTPPKPGPPPEFAPLGSLPAILLALVGCLTLWLGFTLVMPNLAMPTHTIGFDHEYRLYQDDDHRLALDDFLALDASELETQHRPMAQGYREVTYWMAFTAPSAWFSRGELWLELAPSYLDHLTLYWRAQGSDDPWQTRHAGDRDGASARAGDLGYRHPVFTLPPPPAGASGYEMIVQLRSTSTLLLEPRFWEPAAFTAYATRDSVFWSFYFGACTVSTALALVLAIGLRTRLLWSVLPFSTTYLLVACVQGFVGWSEHEWRVTLQHYLTGFLTLLGYPTLLWMCTEALELRKHHPRLYRTTLIGIAIGVLLPIGILLDLYGAAVQALALFAVVTAPIMLATSLHLWWRGKLGPLNLVFGLVPMIYVGSSFLALLTTTAVIPYDRTVYQLWQYAVLLIMMLTMLLVMIVGVWRIRQERLLHEEREQLAHDLRLEREARFQQRQFMGMISHEFRTPLAVIAGAVENLKRQSGGSIVADKRLDRLDRAARRLVQLTDHCLADARLSARELYLDRQPTDALAVIRQAADLAAVISEQRLRITLNGAPLPDQPAPSVPLLADAALLRIALSNLLDNAIKHSPPHGSIEVAVRQMAQDAGLATLRIQVCDQGPGIDPVFVDSIFERFQQGDMHGHERGQGWGLGLHVARQIALAHQGDLKLVRNSPEGCCFELSLPIAVHPPPPP